MIKLHSLRFLFFFAQNNAVFSVVSNEISFQPKNDLCRLKNGFKKCACSDKTIKLHFICEKTIDVQQNQ